MMKLSLICLFFTFILTCSINVPNILICSPPVEIDNGVTIDNEKLLFHSTMFVTFGEGFEKDSLELFYHGELIEAGLYSTDYSLGICFNDEIEVGLDSNIINHCLVIKDQSNNVCCEVQLNTYYQSITINHYDAEWYISYTNNVMIYE